MPICSIIENFLKKCAEKKHFGVFVRILYMRAEILPSVRQTTKIKRRNGDDPS